MSARKKAQVAFALAVVLLFLSGISAYFTIVKLLESEQWVIHSYEVQAALGDVDSAIARAGRARAVYVFTSNQVSADEFEIGASEVSQRILRLQELTRDNPEQQEFCTHLQEVTQNRIGLFRESIALEKTSPSDNKGQGAITTQSAVVASKTTSIMEQMRDKEQRLLEYREQTSNRLFSMAVGILAGTFVLALVLFSVHYQLLSGELGAREQAERTTHDSEESLRRLTARLLKLQDEERQKISRELHDSLGQYLAGIKMHLEMFARSHPADKRLEESIELLDQSITEVRTISHLLHPPLLDETGFASAAKWYVEGFARRSGIEVNLNIPDKMGRLAEPLELGLFRVVQESLTNIHRHSKSSKADISLILLPDTVVLRIKDYGKGIPQDLLKNLSTQGTRFGVGLAGMRERIHELGGHLDVHSTPAGTLISATIPRSKPVKLAEVAG